LAIGFIEVSAEPTYINPHSGYKKKLTANSQQLTAKEQTHVLILGGILQRSPKVEAMGHTKGYFPLPRTR
jgi:hypothetical protein